MLDLFFSFYLSCRPLLSCATNRPLLFLRSKSGTVFQDSSTRDARENNLESTLVVTATVAATTLPATHSPTRRPKMSFHSLFHFLPFAAAALWIVWSEVMARPGNRKLPAMPSRINRRWTVGDVRGTLLQRIFDFRLLRSVALSTISPSFFVLSENYLGLWSSDRPSTYR